MTNTATRNDCYYCGCIVEGQPSHTHTGLTRPMQVWPVCDTCAVSRRADQAAPVPVPNITPEKRRSLRAAIVPRPGQREGTPLVTLTRQTVDELIDDSHALAALLAHDAKRRAQLVDLAGSSANVYDVVARLRAQLNACCLQRDALLLRTKEGRNDR